jgi:hypothetical protein
VTLADVLARARQLGTAAAPGVSSVVGWVWSHRTLVLAGLVVVLVALNARSCRRAGLAEGELSAAAARAAEEARAKPVAPVFEQVPQAVVDEETKAILAAHPALLARVKELEGRIGKLKAVLALHGSTAVTPATGPARPGEPPPGAAPQPDAPAVLLRHGDGLRLALDGVGLQGQKGSLSLLLDVSAFRAADEAELGRAPLAVPLTTALLSELSAPQACPAAVAGRRWRAGPAGGLAGGPGGGGWLAGLAGTYRLDLWGWRPDLFLAGGAGTGGAAALAGVLF